MAVARLVDGGWLDLEELKKRGNLTVVEAAGPKPLEFSVMPRGHNGAPLIGIRANLPRGKVVILETTLAALQTIVRMLQEKCSGVITENALEQSRTLQLVAPGPEPMEPESK